MAETQRERRRTKNRRRESGEFLSSFRVAAILGISPWTLVVWRRQKSGPRFVRIGRNTIRYPRREFEAWLAALPQS